MGKDGLGEFELIVLLAVMRLGDEQAHTLAVLEDIRRRTGRSPQRAAIYITLQRLEKKGLVSSWIADPRPERGGKGRRYFRLEPSAIDAVRRAHVALKNMWSGLEPDLAEDRS